VSAGVLPKSQCAVALLRQPPAHFVGTRKHWLMESQSRKGPKNMSYFQITAKVDDVDESSYTVQSTGEIVTKIQLSLVVPGMCDRVLCEMPLDKAPKTDLLERWELEESWVVVSAEGMRALAFERSNARAGEKPVGALVVFQAVTYAKPARMNASNSRQRARHRRSPPSSAGRSGKPRSERQRRQSKRYTLRSNWPRA
jgi:hypothetical protein